MAAVLFYILYLHVLHIVSHILLKLGELVFLLF